METILADDRTESMDERLVWHRPELKRLSVSLDTRQGLGSFTDFAGGYSTTPIAG